MNTSSLFKELSQNELEIIIKKHFKQVEFECSLLKGGMYNTTYLIYLVAIKKKFVLRVGPVNRHLLLSYEHNLMNGEKYFYELCSQQNIPFSKVVVCDTDKFIIDRDYMIVEYIKSKPLSEIDMPQYDKGKLYEQVGAYVKKIHCIGNDKFGRLSDIVVNKGFYKWSEYLISENNHWAVSALQTGIFTKSEVKKVNEILINNISILDEITLPKLVHSDLWEGNILILNENDNYNVAAIIDGDRAIFGDIDFDFASGWMINEFFMNGYGKLINSDGNNTIRKQIYSMIFHLIDTYVWKIEYNNEKNSLSNRKSALELIERLC